jgi:cobalt/nickel transport system ATP-binding protein
MTTPILSIHALSYCYPGYTAPALQDIDLSLPAGAKVAVVGRNGSGKSTLFLQCNAILHPSKGDIEIDGRQLNYDRRSIQAARQQVGIVFQNPDDQLFSASVAQDISFGPLNLGLSVQEVRDCVDETARLCEVNNLLDRPTHALSGGQKARVALAGVLAMQPRILIVDEALAMLDPWMRRQMLAIFDNLVAQGKTVLLSTHDWEMVRDWADLVIAMQSGRILSVDTPKRAFANPALRVTSTSSEPAASADDAKREKRQFE